MNKKDLSKCPLCNGPADSGYNKELSEPTVYLCTKCRKAHDRKMKQLRETYRLRGS